MKQILHKVFFDNDKFGIRVLGTEIVFVPNVNVTEEDFKTLLNYVEGEDNIEH